MKARNQESSERLLVTHHSVQRFPSARQSSALELIQRSGQVWTFWSLQCGTTNKVNKNTYGNRKRPNVWKKKKKRQQQQKEREIKENLKWKCILQGYTKELEKKVPTYLVERGRISEFFVEPVPAHSHELPRRVPIGIGETRYQPNHGILGLKVIPVP